MNEELDVCPLDDAFSLMTKVSSMAEKIEQLQLKLQHEANVKKDKKFIDEIKWILNYKYNVIIFDDMRGPTALNGGLAFTVMAEKHEFDINETEKEIAKKIFEKLSNNHLNLTVDINNISHNTFAFYSLERIENKLFIRYGTCANTFK